MKRYQGERLPDGANVAVITNDALGNFMVATPLMKMLTQQIPNVSLDYFGGKRVIELADNFSYVGRHYPLFGSSPHDFAARETTNYDLVINCERMPWAMSSAAILAGPDSYVVGASVSDDGRGELPFADDERGRLNADQGWVDEDLTERFPMLDSGYVGEIFCRLAYLEGAVPAAEAPKADPGREVPDILVSCSASLDSKLWPTEKWVEVLSTLKSRGFSIGVLGAKPSVGSKFWGGTATEDAIINEAGVEDLRGTLSIPQVVGAMERCRQIITIDNGLLHAAASVGTPTVGLFRHAIHRLWAPPVESLSVIEPGPNASVADLSPELILEHVRL
jgi:ADP-heptose:LPS heptosyltransferase